jgi:hypothetical protein
MGLALIRVAARVLHSGAVLAALLLFFGCATPPGPPEPSDQAFVGPEISLAPSVEQEQILIAQLPTPGWELTLDATREAYRRTNVFVTFRKPNPAFVYPQVIVTQRLATTVRSGIPIVVYARILEFEDHSRGPSHNRVTLDPPAEPTAQDGSRR